MRTRQMMVLGIVLCAAASARATTVDEVIAKHIKARGGADKLKAVQTLRMTGKLVMGPGMEAPFVVEIKRPRHMRAEFTFQNMTGIQALDGEKGWQVNPFLGKKEPTPLLPEELKEAEDQADFDGPLVDWKAKGHKVELVGKDKGEGAAWKLKVTQKNGDLHFVYLDAAGLEIRDESKRKVRGTEMEFESSSTDYKEVGGVMFPHAIESGAKGSAQRVKIQFTKIDVNPKIDDARFKMPAAPAPKADGKK